MQSQYIASRFRVLHKKRPSLRAHNSASTLVALPIFRVQPAIHIPLLFRTKPPPLALHGFPNEEPSVLSLNQLAAGLVQLTLTLQ